MILLSKEEVLSKKYNEMIPIKCDICGKILHRMQKYVKSDAIKFPKKKDACSKDCIAKLKFIPRVVLNCDQCQKQFCLKKCVYLKRIKDNKSEKSCCSQKCANKLNIFKSEESKKKVSNTLKEYYKEKIKNAEHVVKCRGKDRIASVKNQCIICSKEFFYYREKKICSKECKHIFSIELGKKAGRISAAVPRNKKNRSYNEKLFFSKLKEFYPEAQHTQRIFDGWDADIVIPSLKLAIHWNGPWHYKPILGQELLDKVVWKDKMRYSAVVNAGYHNYIIKDSGKKSDKKVDEELVIFLEKFKQNDGSSTG